MRTLPPAHRNRSKRMAYQAKFGKKRKKQSADDAWAGEEPAAVAAPARVNALARARGNAAAAAGRGRERADDGPPPPPWLADGRPASLDAEVRFSPRGRGRRTTAKGAAPRREARRGRRARSVAPCHLQRLRQQRHGEHVVPQRPRPARRAERAHDVFEPELRRRGARRGAAGAAGGIWARREPAAGARTHRRAAGPRDARLVRRELRRRRRPPLPPRRRTGTTATSWFFEGVFATRPRGALCGNLGAPPI